MSTRKNYWDNIPDEAAFYAWLRKNGWEEDTSPETEKWPVPAWWHAGRMIALREDWLADEYLDYLYEQKTKSIG